MRIDAYNQIQQMYQTQKVRKAQTTASVAHVSDKVQISNMGMNFQIAKAAVAGAPDIREDLTASIKSRIQSGTYSVDPESFADKLLKKYEEMR